jgi:hypothetical protein
MKKKKWTNEEWEHYLAINGYDPYDLGVLFEALSIKEFGYPDISYVKGISGFQHDMAVKLSKLIPDKK